MLGRRSAIGAIGGLAAAVVGCAGTRKRPAGGGDDDPPRYGYGPHPSQFVEISLPDGDAPVPVVVVVHGGFWRTRYGAELGRPLAADLRGRGFAVANVEYRRVGPEGTAGGGWPQTGADVAAAVDALAADGQRLAGGRLDLRRVIAIGHSAGGQLAGWLAARRFPTVALTGVVLQAGVLDLVLAADQGLGGGAVTDFLGGTPAERPAAYADASPIARVPFGVPSVCVHGTDDTIVPIEQSRRFVDAATAAGDTSRLAPFDGDHFALIDVRTRAWTLCADAVTEMTR